MTRNPRPIPMNFHMIAPLAEMVLDGIENELLVFKGSSCDAIPFAESWRREYRDCFSSKGVPTEGAVIEVPFNLQMRDVTGEYYHLKGILIEFEPDIRGMVSSVSEMDELFPAASWLEMSKFDAKKNVKEAKEILKEVKEIESELPLVDSRESRSQRSDLKTIKQRATKSLLESNRILQDGGVLTINFSLIKSPKELRRYLKVKRKEVLYQLQDYLVHEITHLRDTSTIEGTGVGFNKEEYWNHPHEVRAEMQRIIFQLWRALLWDQSVNWNRDLKPRFVREPFDVVFADYIYSTRVDWNGYFPKNQAKIRFAVVQWLKENGFDLPRRKL